MIHATVYLFGAATFFVLFVLVGIALFSDDLGRLFRRRDS